MLNIFGRLYERHNRTILRFKVRIFFRLKRFNDVSYRDFPPTTLFVGATEIHFSFSSFKYSLLYQ